MPKHRPQLSIRKSDIRLNKQQAVQAQAISFGQAEAIQTISASYSSTPTLRLVQRGTSGKALATAGAVSISATLNVLTKIMLNGQDIDQRYTSLSHSHTLTFPTGSVFLTDSNTNPGTLLGYGTWSSLGSGALFSATVYSWQRTA